MEEISIDFSDNGNWKEYEDMIPLFTLMSVLGQHRVSISTTQATYLANYIGKMSYDSHSDKCIFELVEKE